MFLSLILGKLSIEEANYLVNQPSDRLRQTLIERLTIHLRPLFSDISPNGKGYYSNIQEAKPLQLSALSSVTSENFEDIVDSYSTGMNLITSIINGIVDHDSTVLFDIGKTYGDENCAYKGLQSRLDKYKKHSMYRFIALSMFYDEEECFELEKALLGRYEGHKKLHPTYNARGRKTEKEHDFYVVYLAIAITRE